MKTGKQTTEDTWDEDRQRALEETERHLRRWGVIPAKSKSSPRQTTLADKCEEEEDDGR